MSAARVRQSLTARQVIWWLPEMTWLWPRASSLCWKSRMWRALWASAEGFELSRNSPAQHSRRAHCVYTSNCSHDDPWLRSPSESRLCAESKADERLFREGQERWEESTQIIKDTRREKFPRQSVSSSSLPLLTS